MNKVVSIITPSFNRGYIIHETAKSIFNQTYPHWEWMIVDDGSTDNTWGIIQKYAAEDSRVKILKRNREPKGACVCRNIAIENCTGDYLIFVDTDDLMADYCLQQRVDAMNDNPDCDFVIFPMLLFKNQPDDLKLLWNVDNDIDDLKRILQGNPVCQGTGPLWKTSSFKHIGMWKEDLMLWQDIELHIRSLLWPMKYIKRLDLRPDVFLRVSDDSLSRVGFYSKSKMNSRVVVYTFACNRIAELNKLLLYKDALRVMGADIVSSVIRSRYFEQLDDILNLCEKYNIFNDSEIKLYRRYAAATKMRIYKLPFLYNPIKEKAEHIVTTPENTLAKIKWEHPIGV